MLHPPKTATPKPGKQEPNYLLFFTNSQTIYTLCFRSLHPAKMSHQQEESNMAFEGFEKRLEIDFTNPRRSSAGLRSIPRDALNEILTAAQCTIVSSLSNTELDSYVLSESSLFIYPTKIVIKTCGTTQLLRAIPPLLRHAAPMKPKWCRYSRGSFLFPNVQPFPHRSFDEEVTFLERCLGHMGNSSAHVMTDDIGYNKWYVYSCGQKTEESFSLEVCMTGLDKSCARKFFKSPGNDTAREMTENSGIDMLMPETEICDFVFDPCGYSMNGIDVGGEYSTIHVTPEDGYSYASFELMGYDPCMAELRDLLDRVSAVFKPSSLSFSVFATDSGAVSPVTPTGYQCQSSNCQELTAGGFVVFHTFSKLSAKCTEHDGYVMNCRCSLDAARSIPAAAHFS